MEKKTDKVSFALHNSEAAAFFLYAYFGIVAKPRGEIQETCFSAIKKCVYRAYLDMCRTLDLKSDDQSFAKKYCNKIAEAWTGLNSVEKMKERAYNLFFEEGQLRKEIREYLCDKRNSELFSYGQAQKWINMSLKYMWLIGLLPPDAEEKLDVPIDGLVLKAEGLQRGNQGTPWSRLSKENYDKLNEIIKRFADDEGRSPIRWECEEWILQAAKASMKNSKKQWLWEQESKP